MPRSPLLLLLVFAFSRSLAEDASRLIRSTEAQSPEEERKGFTLPPGFSIQLFADETQLGGKPINMAFDARGRLWVTCTREYPFAVKKDRWSADTTHAKDSKDTIRILEDTDGDGRADKVTIFADELNIPTGVLPWKDGCIAWSIPNILFLEDTQHEGRAEKADKRTILFGPLGYEKDTHGMISSLRLGLDGWVYATHGFSNTSHFEVRAKMTNDGMTNDEKGQATKQSRGDAKASSQASSFVIRHSSLDLTSGAVFRFKPDGSEVEPYTSGQVNPFGLCWDSWGNLYSADCHSNPITQLIRGAEYPQFGKPAGPLGFGPVMCEHAHGSTGIAGIIYLDGGVWGPEWDDHMFVGNPVTSKVSHDRITFTGSTPKANEQPDFITSADGWFRPVDLQLGPDSALYIADFYNKIIGHYEVPLDHAGRDRERGRIWRVVREGFTGRLTECDLSRRDAKRLVSAMKSPNITKRWLATQQAVADPSPTAAAIFRAGLMSSYNFGNGVLCRHLMWTVAQRGDYFVAARRSGQHGDERDLPLLPDSPWFLWSMPPEIASAAVYVRSYLREQEQPQIWRGLPPPAFLLKREKEGPRPSQPNDSRVRRAIATLDRFGRRDAITFDFGSVTYKLFEWLERANANDLALQHELRITIRQRLQPRDALAHGRFEYFRSPESEERFAGIVASVNTEEAAGWLLDYLKREKRPPANAANLFTAIARHLPADRDSELVTLAQKHFGDDLDTQLDLLAAIREGRSAGSSLAFQSRDASPAPTTTKPSGNPALESQATGPLTAWAAQLAQRLLDTLQSEPADTWHPLTPPTDANPNPWHPITRKCADGQERLFLDSHAAPGSEKLTGTLRSAGFPLPPKLTFWLAGHRGFPTGAAHEKNFVRLVDAATGAELARAYPPRNDTAREVVWIVTDSGSMKSSGAGSAVAPPFTSGSPPFTSGSPPPTSGSPPPTSGSQPSTSGSPPSTSGSPASTSGSPASTSGSPASTSGSPASTSGSPASTSGSPASTSGGPPSTSSGLAGTPVFLELTDGDSGTAYAWLAAGGFEPAVVSIPAAHQQRDKRILALAQLCGTGSLPVGVTGDSPVTEAKSRGQAARDTHRLAAGATDFLAALPAKHTFTPDTREAIARAVSLSFADRTFAPVIPLVRDQELAEPVMGIVTVMPELAVEKLSAAFNSLPFRNQVKLATALAANREGTAHLLALAAPRVLADPLVSTKIKALGDATLNQKLTALTASLPPQNEALGKLIAQRFKSFDPEKADATRGEQVFTTVCSVCHRIGVRGNLVGPQLDGIGARGAERLLEDILDPNRSVDPAFRLHLVKRKDGTLHTGLLRREEGDSFVYADATAQETRIAKADIAQDDVSEFSLMPPGLGDVLTAEQLHDLLAYLLERK